MIDADDGLLATYVIKEDIEVPVYITCSIEWLLHLHKSGHPASVPYCSLTCVMSAAV